MIQYVLASLFTRKQQLKTMKQATRKPTTPGDILLYEYLEPLDLKINELAELLHVHRNSVSALINNNRKLKLLRWHFVWRKFLIPQSILG